MRALLPFLLVAMVQPLRAQRVLALGDTVQVDYRVKSPFVYRVSDPFLGRVVVVRLEGVLGQLTADSVVLQDTAGSRAVARKDLLSTRRLSGRGFDWDKATVPMAVGGGVGLILGAGAVSEDNLSGGEAALAITAFTVMGALPGLVKGLDSHGRTGFTIGALVGAAAGLAVGIANMPEPSPPCDPASPFCIDVPDLGALYVLVATGIGASGGGLIGGIVGSLKPGKRWEKLPLPPTALGLRPLPGGRVGLVISVATH